METAFPHTTTTAYRIDRDDEPARNIAFEPLLGGEARSGQLTGTRALMLAVLEDAIRAYLSNSVLAAKDAEFWIQSHRRQSPFSFIVVCEVLGLDPDAVRGMILKMRSNASTARKGFPRARHNVRIPGKVCIRRSPRVEQ